MERLLYSNLLAWKNAPSRKPLLLEGAHHVGKTWLLKQFGEQEYDNVAYINCANNELMQKSFDDFDIPRIIMNLSLISNTDIKQGKTLIILDEIQEVPKAITSLKYFCEDAPEYHIAASSSLLWEKGKKKHKANEDSGTGFPVGKVDKLKLYPLSFTEFLLALKEDNLVSYIKQHKWEELNTFKPKLLNYLRQYYFVGGMPAVVNEFITSKNLSNVRMIQNEILRNYKTDFTKHTSSTLISKLYKVWESIPSQLARDNKKFIYSAIRPGARATEFEEAIEWLIKAGFVYKVKRVKNIEMPLKVFEDSSSFTLFINDLGLLGALCDIPAKDVLIGSNIFSSQNKSFTEQYIAQQLVSTIGEKVYYYSNDNSSLKIDFVIQTNKVYPIEVQGKENLKSKSLSTVLNNSPSLFGLRFSLSDYREQERMNNIPLPLAEEYINALAQSD